MSDRSCPQELTLAIYIDGELAAGERRQLEMHLDGCAGCRELVAGLEGENRALVALLAEEPVAARRAERGWGPIAALLAVPILLRLWREVWEGLAGNLLPGWLDPLSPAGGLNLSISGLFYLVKSGGVLMSWSYSLLSLLGVSLLLLASAVLLARRIPGRRALPLALLSLMILAVSSVPALALEVRRGDVVTVPAGETLDETLIAFGETVRVNGDVLGDLVVFGRQVSVSGEVQGSLYAFGQTVDVEGGVTGSIVAFAQWTRITERVGGNAYLLGQSVRLLSSGSVDGDTLVCGELLDIEGQVGRDLGAAGRQLTVAGTVGRDILVGAEEVVLSPSAYVGGDITSYLAKEENLKIGDGAQIAGSTTVEVSPREVHKSRYGRPGFYLWRVVGLIGAFLVGALLFFAMPGFFEDRPQGAMALLKRVGLGFVILVATPVGLVICGITLVGLPISLMGLALFLAALYLAQIAVAEWLGRGLLKPAAAGARKVFPALLLGLAILVVVGNLPWIGGWIRFLVLLLGLGMLAYRARAGWQRRVAPT